MKKHENSSEKNKNRKSKERSRTGGYEDLFEIMSQCCGGQRQSPDCCSGMKKMWEDKQDNPLEDRK